MTGFADVETITIAALQLQFPSARVLTTNPADLESVLPVVRVTRIGGTGSALTLDDCLVNVEVFAALRPDAKTLANQIRSYLTFKLPGYRYLGAVVANVLTSVGPSERPYGNANVSRIGATYQITLHNQF